MVIGLIGAIWLETGLAHGAAELVFLFLAIVIGAVVLICVHTDHHCAWNMTLTYFALLLLNAGLAFAHTINHVVAFAVASMAPLFGLMLALMHVSESAEHYGMVPLDEKNAPKKRGRPKKN